MSFGKLQHKQKKFIVYSITNPITGEVREDNMTLKEWERLQRDTTRKKHFKFIKEIDLTNAVPTARDGKVADIPIEEDVLECPLCGFIAENDDNLKDHKLNKHEQAY